MKIGVVADDFSGASDIGGILAGAGAATVLHQGIPDALPDCDAAVIALKTRSIPAAEAVAQSRAAAAALVSAGAGQIVFKYCSTFDSTPKGNIGPVAEALLADLGGELALVCPAFPANARTVYQGHLFVGDRLLSESGMARHPLTPMTDPDLRRWLALQTRLGVGHLDLATLRDGGGAAALEAAARDGRRLIVCDAVADADLLALAALAAGHRLVTGGSAIAAGLVRNHGIAPHPVALAPVAGDAIILAGSCSEATRGQVRRHAAAHPVLELAIDGAASPQAEAGRALDFVLANRGRLPLVTSTREPAAVAAIQARHGAEASARFFEEVLAEVAAGARAAGFRRIVVAGGETSGAVALRLDLGTLRIGPPIDPGVPAMQSMDADPVGLVLKSGNFGREDFLARAAAVLEAGS